MITISMCIPLPIAATLLQPLGAPLVLALMAALAYYGYRYGLFLATLAGLHALAAVVAALGLTSPVAAWLELADVPRHYALPGAFLGVLAVVAIGIRLAIGAAVPPDVVKLPPRIDQLGGVIVGGISGLVVAGVVLLAFSIAPLPPAYRIDGSRLSFDMGSRLLDVFVRCLSGDVQTRDVLLRGEPGTAAAGGPVARPAWSEPFVDADGSLTRDDGEAFVDTDANGTFTPELTAADVNGNGRRDVGLLEHYRVGHWLPLTVIQAPVVTSKDSAYVTDGDPIETVVYQATASDADPGDTTAWSLKPGQDNDSDLLVIDATTGAVTLKSPPDREAKNIYAFTVVVTDKAGLTAERPVTLHVTKPLKSDREPSPGLTAP
ncbi:MAG: cadherin repeat domain-containing protein [Planctomycetia bacterium]